MYFIILPILSILIFCTYVYKYVLSMNDLYKVYEWLGHQK